jgi:hypothetical protein
VVILNIPRPVPSPTGVAHMPVQRCLDQETYDRWPLKARAWERRARIGDV